MLEDGYTTTDLGDVLQQMGGQHNGSARGSLADERAKTDPLVRVQADGWFIQEEDGRIVGQGSRQADTLALTSGKSSDSGRGHVAEVHHRECCGSVLVSRS